MEVASHACHQPAGFEPASSPGTHWGTVEWTDESLNEPPRALAAATGAELIRLQCHEGIDVHHALYDWDHPRQLLALAVSYCGVLLVFGHEANLTGADTLKGAALVFGGALSYAVYLVTSGAEVKRLGALRLTGWATSVACVLCILQFVLLRPLDAALVAPQVVWLSVLNALLCTFAPVLMVMLAIERVGATMTAQTGMIGPISTILMGVVILGEPFNAWIGAGTALVLVGVWLLARGR